MVESIKNIFVQDRRTAIVNDKVITGCWQCRYHMRVHEKDKPDLHWCEANKTGVEYRGLSNIYTIPDECKFLVKEG